MKHFIKCILFLLPLFSFTQNCDCCISGKILDKNLGTPVAFATIQVKNSKKYTVADDNGNFKIENFCPDNYAFVISCLGYTGITTEEKRYSRGTTSIFYLSQDLTTLDEAIVKAERDKDKGTETIAQITLGKEDIKTIPTGSLGTSLSKIEGVTFAATGTNVQLPIIHGLSGNRILVLNNGLKHGFQNWGNEHAPEIDINSVNNITVIKGAAGVRYGPEALAGVILIEPNPLLLDNPLYGNIGAGYETNGRGGNANFEIGKGTEKWSYFFNGSFTKIGDRRSPDYNLTNTGKEEGALSFGVRHKLNDKWDFKAYYSFVDQNLGLLRSSFPESGEGLATAFNAPEPLIIDSFSYDISYPRETTQHHLTKAEIDWSYAEDAKLTFRAGAQLNKRQEFAVRTGEQRSRENPIIDLDLITYDYQLDWEHPTWKGIEGVIGMQYFTLNNDNNDGTLNIVFLPNYNTFRFGVFAIEKIKIGNNTLEAGIRFDIENNDVRGREQNQDIFKDQYTFSNFTASLGYQWQLSDNSSFKTNLGSAFRTPNVAELFSFGPSGFTSTFGLLRFTDNNGVPSTSKVIPFDESNVKKETGYKLTNEYRTSNENNAHALTTYVNYITYFIFDRPIGVTKTISGTRAVFIVDQADALFLGLDYTWRKEFSEQFNTTFGLSYLWSRNIGKGEVLINQPPISTNLQLEWSQDDFWIFDDSKFTLRPSYTFQQFQAPQVVPIESINDGSANITLESEIFDFLPAPNGYFLLDASWNFKINRFEGNLAAQNLLNNSYRNYLNDLRYFADEPGINLLLTLNYKF